MAPGLLYILWSEYLGGPWLNFLQCVSLLPVVEIPTISRCGHASAGIEGKDHFPLPFPSVSLLTHDQLAIHWKPRSSSAGLLPCHLAPAWAVTWRYSITSCMTLRLTLLNFVRSQPIFPACWVSFKQQPYKWPTPRFLGHPQTSSVALCPIIYAQMF